MIDPLNTNTTKNQTKSVVTKKSTDLQSSETREQRNIFQLLRPTTLATLQLENNEQEAQESKNEVSYYTNVLLTNARSLKPEDRSMVFSLTVFPIITIIIAV